MEETKEEPLNFTISFDLTCNPATLQASNENQSNKLPCENFMVNFK